LPYGFCKCIVILKLIMRDKRILIIIFLMQRYEDRANCGYTLWVDPAPIPELQSYIDYLESRIANLEEDLAALAPAEEDELVIGINDEKWCDDGPRCRCPHHKFGRANTPPPPPPHPFNPTPFGGTFM